ncbi:MAG: hypothetical protein A3F67_06985 [Verrucomicrobia bacterium RIFCSPHIGHO2_12_FULL_41_10]|nr:MAG: hypothetical protein A3F67_06985 [Verrucomicrobia bacterium RIFCSPHIGHO2_12_FULL_41_10]
MSLSQFPLINASLNAISAFFLLAGWCFIKYYGKYSANPTLKPQLPSSISHLPSPAATAESTAYSLQPTASIIGHACCMMTAFVTSCLFLGCYLFYHFNIPGHHVAFTGQGWPRIIYFFILFTHLPLALILVPLVVMTFTPALRARFDQHKKIARWTLPIWLYVSITGVIVYFMLYVWYR